MANGLDHQIVGCEQRLASARARGNSRETARLVDELKGLKVRRMKRDKRRGLFREVAQVAALFVGGYFAIGIAQPLDAYAATPDGSVSSYPDLVTGIIIGLAIAMGARALWVGSEKAKPADDERRDPKKFDHRRFEQ